MLNLLHLVTLLLLKFHLTLYLAIARLRLIDLVVPILQFFLEVRNLIDIGLKPRDVQVVALDLILYPGEIDLQGIECLIRCSSRPLQHIDSGHPVQECAELFRGRHRLPLGEIEGVHRFAGAEVEASLDLALHLQCPGCNLLTRWCA